MEPALEAWLWVTGQSISHVSSPSDQVTGRLGNLLTGTNPDGAQTPPTSVAKHAGNITPCSALFLTFFSEFIFFCPYCFPTLFLLILHSSIFLQLIWLSSRSLPLIGPAIFINVFFVSHSAIWWGNLYCLVHPRPTQES